MLLDDDFINMMHEDVVAHDPNNENIMCCCRKYVSHDETMKFKLKVAPQYQNTGEGSILDQALFKSRHAGPLIQLEEEQTNKMKIPVLIEKQSIIGYHSAKYQSV